LRATINEAIRLGEGVGKPLGLPQPWGRQKSIFIGIVLPKSMLQIVWCARGRPLVRME
jgi:hypothetical protein